MNGVSTLGVPSVDCLQVLFQSCSITVSKCARSSLTSSSLNSLNNCVQTCSITASKWISNLARLWPPCSHDHGLQVHISKLTWLWPPSASSSSLDYSFQDRTIMASKCIYNLTASWSQSASLGSLDSGLEVNLQILSIDSSKCIPKLTQS